MFEDQILYLIILLSIYTVQYCMFFCMTVGIRGHLLYIVNEFTAAYV